MLSNKLTEQLKYAGLGIIGILIPALAVSTSASPVVVASAIGLTLITGLYVGRDTGSRADELAISRLERKLSLERTIVDDLLKKSHDAGKHAREMNDAIERRNSTIDRLSAIAGNYAYTRRTEVSGLVKSDAGVEPVTKAVKEYVTLSDANVAGYTKNVNDPTVLKFNTQQVAVLVKQALNNAGYSFFLNTQIEKLEDTDVTGS